MRPTSLLLSLCLASLVACSAEPLPSSSGPTLDLIGSLEPLDPSDPASPWIGTELVRVTDPDGELTCETDVDLDALLAQSESCQSCEVTLDMVRSVVQELGDACGLTQTEEIRRGATLLAWAPHPERLAGRVLVAESIEGPWTDFGGGVMDQGQLVYHRTVSLPSTEYPDPADLDLRDLAEAPLIP